MLPCYIQSILIPIQQQGLRMGLKIRRDPGKSLRIRIALFLQNQPYSTLLQQSKPLLQSIAAQLCQRPGNALLRQLVFLSPGQNTRAIRIFPRSIGLPHKPQPLLIGNTPLGSGQSAGIPPVLLSLQSPPQLCLDMQSHVNFLPLLPTG